MIGMIEIEGVVGRIEIISVLLSSHFPKNQINRLGLIGMGHLELSRGSCAILEQLVILGTGTFGTCIGMCWKHVFFWASRMQTHVALYI